MDHVKTAMAGITVLLGLSTSVTAVPIRSDVDYTNSMGDLAVTGSFIYDADLNTYSAVNLMATDDADYSNTTYWFAVRGCELCRLSKSGKRGPDRR
jgi:hypothetical protein